MESDGGKCEGCETKIEECSKENCPGRRFKNHIFIEKSYLVINKLTISITISFTFSLSYNQLIAIGQSGQAVNVQNHAVADF